MTKKEEILEIVKESGLNPEDKKMWENILNQENKESRKAYDAILDILRENKKAITTMTNFIKESTMTVSGEGSVDLEKYKKELDQLLD